MFGVLASMTGPIVIVPASSRLVEKIGRFDSPQSGAERASWTGSAVELRATGPSVTATIDNTGENFLEVEINGTLTKSIRLDKGKQNYTIDLPGGVCELRLVKRTEASIGPITFLSFGAGSGGHFMAPARIKHLIEFVGDSITCGYGNEGTSEKDHFTPATENGDSSYGWIAARELHAGASIIAWSGRKMWPDNTTPEIYDLTIPTDPTTKYDFADHPKPDVVLINLATNDFGKTNPDKTGWCGAYEAFIGRLRTLYPKAEIYCAIGSMMNDGWPPKQMALTTLRSYIQTIVDEEKKKGDEHVSEIEFAVQNPSDGLGADYHPNIKTDGIMADTLVKRIKSDLHW